MYFNAPRLQQRVPIKKHFLGENAPKPPGLANSRLRRSICKFQFLLAKPNPMPSKQSDVITVKHSKTSDMLHVLQDFRCLDIEK